MYAKERIHYIRKASNTVESSDDEEKDLFNLANRVPFDKSDFGRRCHMDFWIFMLIMELLMPFTMIGFGRYFSNQAPKEINSTFGYRTKMSIKNRETWEFAHKYFGKLWYICGLVLLPISIILMLFLRGQSEDVIGNAGAIICIVQLIPLLGSVFLTEKVLKKNFDKNGKKQQSFCRNKFGEKYR